MTEQTSAKKSLGQHWLTDRAALESIVQAADVNPDDVVLEIGPGTGTLSEVLLYSGAEVRAVEFDKSLITDLETKFQANPKFNVEQSDIRRFDFTKLPPDYKIVANIPYYLTSHLIQLISLTPNQPVLAVLLVQKEVAERVAAKPGKMSLLSISAQFFWQVSLGRVAEANLFTPPPKVDSQVVILTRRNQPLFGDIDQQAFFRIVKMGFSNRRKTLVNSLAGGLRRGKTEVSQQIESAGLNPGSRPQELSLNDWHSLYKTIDH